MIPCDTQAGIWKNGHRRCVVRLSKLSERGCALRVLEVISHGERGIASEGFGCLHLGESEGQDQGDAEEPRRSGSGYELDGVRSVLASNLFPRRGCSQGSIALLENLNSTGLNVIV